MLSLSSLHWASLFQAYNLSRDHKPDLEVEKERILKAGGFIHAGRVNGSLNLARAIGILTAYMWIFKKWAFKLVSCWYLSSWTDRLCSNFITEAEWKHEKNSVVIFGAFFIEAVNTTCTCPVLLFSKWNICAPMQICLHYTCLWGVSGEPFFFFFPFSWGRREFSFQSLIQLHFLQVTWNSSRISFCLLRSKL